MSIVSNVSRDNEAGFEDTVFGSLPDFDATTLTEGIEAWDIKDDAVFSGVDAGVTWAFRRSPNRVRDRGKSSRAVRQHRRNTLGSKKRQRQERSFKITYIYTVSTRGASYPQEQVLMKDRGVRKSFPGLLHGRPGWESVHAY